VNKQRNIGLNFEVDKLTNSIENVVSGDSFQTEVSILNSKETKSISKKNGWGGFQGAISFLSKSQLIDHYVNTLGAFHLSNRVMIIETKEALKLIGKYFPNSI
jgi:hypothetical protein